MTRRKILKLGYKRLAAPAEPAEAALAPMLAEPEPAAISKPKPLERAYSEASEAERAEFTRRVMTDFLARRLDPASSVAELLAMAERFALVVLDEPAGEIGPTELFRRKKARAEINRRLAALCGESPVADDGAPIASALQDAADEFSCIAPAPID